MVIVALPGYIRILAGQGDEVTLALTDGSTMTGAEYLSRVVVAAAGSAHDHSANRQNVRMSAPTSQQSAHTGAGAGAGRPSWPSEPVSAHIPQDVQFALFHPTQGGVNTYTARFANAKQRDLAAAEHPVCAWPGCYVPSYLCQTHHLHAHSHGGVTSPSNLVPLCSFHNGFNDDDPMRLPDEGGWSAEAMGAWSVGGRQGNGRAMSTLRRGWGQCGSCVTRDT